MKEGLGLLNEWTPETLKKTRESLELSQYDIAEALNTTQATVSNIEKGNSASWGICQLYGILLERYWAYKHNYIPTYRKIGENVFLEGGDVAVV